MDEPLENLIEAVLFYNGGTLTVSELSKSLHVERAEVEKALQILKQSLSNRGIRLISESETVGLATSPGASELIESIRKSELEGPLGKAGLETLAIIVFKGPLSRADIEYVRGVNCTAILRSLMIRGLIERIDNPSDKRSFLYRATADLPAYLGVSSLADMPGYSEMRDDLEKVYASRTEEKEITAQTETTV